MRIFATLFVLLTIFFIKICHYFVGNGKLRLLFSALVILSLSLFYFAFSGNRWNLSQLKRIPYLLSNLIMLPIIGAFIIRLIIPIPAISEPIAAIFSMIKAIDAISIFLTANIFTTHLKSFATYRELAWAGICGVTVICWLLGLMDPSKSMIFSIFVTLIVQSFSLDFLALVKSIRHGNLSVEEYKNKLSKKEKDIFILFKYLSLITLFLVALSEFLVNSPVMAKIFSLLIGSKPSGLIGRGELVLLTMLIFCIVFMIVLFVLSYLFKFIKKRISIDTD